MLDTLDLILLRTFELPMFFYLYIYQDFLRDAIIICVHIYT